MRKRHILTGPRHRGTHRRRRLAFEPLEQRQLLAGDSVEVFGQQPRTDVADNYSVNYSLEIAAGGNVVNRVQIGDEFTVRLHVEHVSANPQGVFAAFADVHFDPTLVEMSGRIAFHGPYRSVLSGMSRPGLVDEVGGLAGIYAIGGGRHLVAEISFVTIAHGTVQFQVGAADDVIQHPTLVYSMNTETPPANISYENAVLTVGSGAPANTQNTATVTKDNVEHIAAGLPADHWNEDAATIEIINGGNTAAAGSNSSEYVYFEVNREPTSLLNSSLVINALPPATGEFGGIVATPLTEGGHNLPVNVLEERRPIRVIDTDDQFVEIARQTEKLELAGGDDEVYGVTQVGSVHAMAFADSMSRSEALTAAATVYQAELRSGSSKFTYDVGRFTALSAVDHSRRTAVDHKLIIGGDTFAPPSQSGNVYVSRDEAPLRAPSTETRALTWGLSADDLQALLHDSDVGFENTKWAYHSSRAIGWRATHVIREKAFQELTADDTRLGGSQLPRFNGEKVSTHVPALHLVDFFEMGV